MDRSFRIRFCLVSCFALSFCAQHVAIAPGMLRAQAVEFVGEKPIYETPMPLQPIEKWPGTFFIETEGFADKGGWVVDQQFTSIMGSPFLLAHGMGEPVNDAKTRVTFPEFGTYRVFIRTRNWVAPWTTRHAPGTFRLLVDGKPLQTVFGTDGDPWSWQSGGSVTISPNKLTVELALHDLTGFDGRADAICFTSDPNYVPPDGKDALEPLRREALGLPRDVPDAKEGPFDLVVVGGGIAGTCSAVSAARLGLKVALIQDRPLLGGNNSSEVRVHLQGKINQPPYPNLGNLVYQLKHKRDGNAQPPEHYEDHKKIDLVAAERNISLYLCTKVYEVEKRGELVTAVLARNIETNREQRFVGTLFADCTGDGTVGFLAGADWRMGRESQEETGESLAPETPDQQVLGASVQWYSVPAGRTTTFPELPWAVLFNEKSIQPAHSADWDWETGLNWNQIDDFEKIRDHGLRAAYGHWSYMKNSATGDWAETVRERKLGWVAYIAGKRESRRLMGDVVLQEQHIRGREIWPDASVTTTWSIDLHYPTKHNTEHFPGEEFRTYAEHVHIAPYAIPYRCFYSRNVPNLFMAGRCISVTHVALGTIRVMQTGGMMGEVVGMAASICKKHGVLPRNVYETYLDELKTLMEEGVAPPPPGRAPLTPPKWLRSAGKNHALEGKATVSSEYAKAFYPAKHVNDGVFNFSDNGPRWVSDESDEPHWVVLEFPRPITVNATRILSGQATAQTPINDFQMQYERDGTWIDIAEMNIENNETSDFSGEFPEVSAKSFRLWITRTPGNLARIWEWELYTLKKR